MKVNMIKGRGGTLSPASDLDEEAMARFKFGEIYEIDIKLKRNNAFHGKVFSFFNYCFEFWSHENEHLTEQRQFDVFRENMTVLAGYYDSYDTIDGAPRIVAKSLSYAAMSQEEFEEFYSALISVAMRKIFVGCVSATEKKLIGFF